MIFNKDYFKELFIILLIGLGVIFLILTSPGCDPNSIPTLDISFWAGDSKKAGITRSQDNETIQCNDLKMDQYTCITYSDLQKVYGLLQRCKQWE